MSGILSDNIGRSSGLVKATSVSAGFTLAAIQASTSGAAINFTGIPSGTTEIIVMLSEVGMNHQTGGIGIQIGDSGGLETASYVGSVDRNNGGRQKRGVTLQ